jgi:hypothetical protein
MVSCRRRLLSRKERLGDGGGAKGGAHAGAVALDPGDRRRAVDSDRARSVGCARCASVNVNGGVVLGVRLSGRHRMGWWELF